MLNYGICQKCKDFLKITEETVEVEILVDHRGIPKNSGPISWSCPVSKGHVNRTDINPPIDCYYRLEQILFFDKKRKSKGRKDIH